mgnify:CR=1 FL=1
MGYSLIAVFIAFSINYAAYFAEIYRGGIESISAGQYEAAKILGYSKAQTFFRIILPQVIKRILPSVTNEVITLVKDTSLAFVVAVSEMFTIAKQIASGAVTLTSKTMTGAAVADDEKYTDFTADLNAGYWLVIVSGTVAEVYNPMLVGVYYSANGSDNTMTSNPVNADSNWTLETSNAYAKSTTPSIKKEIVGGETAKGNDVAIGDTVDFKITTAIPSYSKQYDTVTVAISDTMSAGLTLDKNSIKINGADISADMIEKVETTDHGFTLTVKSDYAKANGGMELVVTYSATVNDQATVNFDPNTNKATLSYTTNPKGDVKTTDSKTYTYTFSIGAALSAATQGYTEKVNQIIKVDEKGNVISKVEEKSQEPDEKVVEVLKGATFTLTNTKTRKVYTAESGEDGGLTFNGLDQGTYTLVETAAPEGFTIDKTEHTVVIAATYNEDGTLNTYTITIDGKNTSTYTATYDKEGKVTTIATTTTVTEIKNTKLSALPSTGGIGTTIFTIGGCAIMIVAAGLFFATRRKTQK